MYQDYLRLFETYISYIPLVFQHFCTSGPVYQYFNQILHYTTPFWVFWDLQLVNII